MILQGNAINEDIYKYSFGERGHLPKVCSVSLLKTLFENCRVGKANERRAPLLEALKEVCKCINAENSPGRVDLPQVGQKRQAEEIEAGYALPLAKNDWFITPEQLQCCEQTVVLKRKLIDDEIRKAQILGDLSADETIRLKERVGIEKERAEIEISKAKELASQEITKTKELADQEITKAKELADQEITKASELAKIELDLIRQRNKIEMEKKSYELELEEKRHFMSTSSSEPAPPLCTVKQVAIQEGIDTGITGAIFKSILSAVGFLFRHQAYPGSKIVEDGYEVNQFNTSIRGMIKAALCRERAKRMAPPGQTLISFSVST